MIDIRRPLNVCRASAGTGKTYTLAAYYIGLLLSGEDYRSILAITFTNKATGEMSERILDYLHAIAEGEGQSFLLRARDFMIRNQQATDEELQLRAGECFRAMLLDYDNVQIQTIDSFLQTLLAGLAGLLHTSAGLSTELDVDHVIRQAVDQLLTTDITDADRTILEDYMHLQLDRESHTDVRKSLCMMAKELYNESVQMLDAENKILFDSVAIAKCRNRLLQAWQDYEGLHELKVLLASCNPANYNRNTKYAYDRLTRSVEQPEKMSGKDRFRGVEPKSCNAEEMNRATELAKQVARYYNSIQLTIRFSRDMELMASLQAIIQRNLAENNCALLAQTANTLCRALQPGDADFILEKAGVRFKHVLMDEFQDTSQLQWSVINQLLRDVLAGEGHTLLVVGDIKQSIYRWRNGDWHIMAELGMDDAHYGQYINRDFSPLTRNYRSSEEVVKFNLSLFRHIITHYPVEHEQALIEAIYDEGFTPERLDDFYQADKKRGGYVRFKAFQKSSAREEGTIPIREMMAREMFDAMEELLQKGARPADMMILVRKTSEAVYITDLHRELDKDIYPLLSKARIVSADSFLLEASHDVQTIIAGLRVIAKDDPVAAKYVEMMTGDVESVARIKKNIPKKTPLYEAVSELIKLLLANEYGHYTGTETAYVNNLLDRTRDYVSAYGSNIDEYLDYWNDVMHEKPIPAPVTDAIRILTVHSSKGLQSQTLFVPFCTWTKEAQSLHPEKIWCEVADEVDVQRKDYVPIQDGDEMANSAYQAAYELEHLNMRVDNLNMLYVALTRAEDNLYISTFYPVNKDGKTGSCNHVGMYIRDFLQTDEYEVGKPVINGVRGLEVRGLEVSEAELWSSSDQVRFVQSQEGAMYTDYGDEAYRRVARMEQGTLCHEIFAHLRKADELDRVLDDFESRGEIQNPTQREELHQLISSAWEGNPQMNSWFTDPWELKMEEAIYIDHREVRPDRVMINPQTHEAIVLDYKFGHPEASYKEQVRGYMQALQRMGYSPVRGYLWFAHNAQGKQLVEVHAE